MMIRGKLPVALLILALLGTGCQGADGGEAIAASTAPEEAVVVIPSGTPSPTATATSTPTQTPTVTVIPTSTPVPTPTPFVCTEASGETVEGVFASESMQESIRYLVHLPPCYSHYEDYALPTLYLLHGWPMDEHHWEGLGIMEIADAWTAQGLSGPLLIVLPGVTDPNGRYVNSSGGSASFEGMMVEELLPRIEQQYRTWRAPVGRAIGGISRGGVWALEIGLRNPDYFGIVGGHSPALSLNYPLPAYDPFLLTEDGLPGQRIYLDAGDADWARAGAIRLRDLMLEQGGDVTYQIHEGTHVDDLWRLGLPDYLTFYTLSWPREVESLPLWEAPVEYSPLDRKSLN